MNISELTVGTKDISLKGEISEKSDPRTVNTRFGTKTVADAMIKDSTGSIKLSLWEKQIDSVNVGDEVELEGGYVTEWRGNLQISVPSKGKITVLGKEDKNSESI